MKRGDALQIILIQVKGGGSLMPTKEDGKRLRAVAKQLHARHVLLAVWKKGTAAQFFRLRPNGTGTGRAWTEVNNLEAVFR